MLEMHLFSICDRTGTGDDVVLTRLGRICRSPSFSFLCHGWVTDARSCELVRLIGLDSVCSFG